jgi:addiction module HigA family antidote
MKTSIKSLHPGVFLRAEIIEPLELDIAQAASMLAIPQQTLSALLQTKIPLDAEMAWRWEKVFDVSMEGLLRMQAAYDSARLRKKPPLHTKFR